MRLSKYRTEMYRAGSNRLKGYDYSSDGAYFITICTKDRENYFGEIMEGKMILNEMGEIVNNQILHVENNFNYVIIDEFIVMPNHVHIIIILWNNDDCRDAINRVSTGDIDNEGWITWKNNIMLQPFSIWNIIRRFKWACTFLCRDVTNRIHIDNLFFAWQPNYHDHIIRDEHELNRIRQYIINNPEQWENDENYRK